MTHENSNGVAENGNSKVPEWLQPTLFEDVLKETVPDYRQIKNFKAFLALAAGENYATVMLRVEIDVELADGDSKLATYMLKVMPDSDMFRDFMEKHNIFHVEMDMYTEIVPEFERLYREAGLSVNFGAKAYRFSVKTPQDYILLEDLRPYGFKNVNRLDGLDMLHTKSVLKKLAQWHAASAVLVEQKGAYKESLHYGFFRADQADIMAEFDAKISAVYMECMQSYEGHEAYYEDVQNLEKNRAKIVFREVEIDESEFNVLNHGDCWCNNIMFQHDEAGNIAQTYLIDYQIPKYGSPAQDLYYFLLSSTQFELKLRQFEHFVQYYHGELVKHLKLLNYAKKLPTLKQLHIDLIRHGFWGYFSCMGVMSVVLLEPNENANLDNFINDTDAGNDFKKQLYANKRFRQHAEAVLSWLHTRGALEM